MNFFANITVISDEVSQDLPDLIRFVKDFSLPGVELRSMFGRVFKDLTAADIYEIKAVARGEGWKVFGCASPVFKCDLDDMSAVQEHLEVFRRSVDVAQDLDCDLIRVFTFLRRSEAENASRLPQVAGYLQKLAVIAERTHVRIGVENEASCIVGNGTEITALCALMSDPCLGIVWDPCNALYVAGVASDFNVEFAKFSARVYHVHVKDAFRLASVSESVSVVAMPIGLGDVGWRHHFSELQRSNYVGSLSLETHWRTVPMHAEELHLPGGYKFSHGGEEASRVCLHNLREMLRYLK